MCRNIRTLFNFEPPATEEEIRASAVQFVRKLSGFNKPSQANAAAFNRAACSTRCTPARLRATARSRRRRRESERASDLRKSSSRAICCATIKRTRCRECSEAL